MKITEVLAKVSKGEALTDEEKSFIGSYDLQKELDTAASAARRKAEAGEKAARDELAAKLAEFEDYKTRNDPSKKDGEMAKLMKRIENLEKAKTEAEAKVAAGVRENRVRELASQFGIKAAKGVSEKALGLLVQNLTADLDLDDAEAVKTAFETFKADNGAMIAAGTVGGADVRGTPASMGFKGKNPFAKDSFNLTEQLTIQQSNPELAEALKTEAAGK